jgi:hypothetical protein
MYADRILKFGEKFRARLDSIDPVLLFGALEYVSHGEDSLAFEILCDHICEHRIPITNDEYNEAIKLASDMKFNLEDFSIKYLELLVEPLKPVKP